MTFFGAGSFVLTVLAYFPYIRAMIKGTTKPKISSWFIWFVLDTVGFLSSLSAGKANWLLLAFCMGASIIAFLSLKYGAPGWDMVDTVSAVIAASSVLAWIAIGPQASLVCMLIGSTVGSLPTIASVFKGNNEDLTAWLMVMGSTTLSFLDGNVLVSVWYLIIQVLIVFPVLYHKYFSNKASPQQG